MPWQQALQWRVVPTPHSQLAFALKMAATFPAVKARELYWQSISASREHIFTFSCRVAYFYLLITRIKTFPGFLLYMLYITDQKYRAKTKNIFIIIILKMVLICDYTSTMLMQLTQQVYVYCVGEPLLSIREMAWRYGCSLSFESS